MQSEKFDRKVKEAADHHYPAYDEQAWGKMEQLLNKHLPQKEDNRRRFLFLLFLFLGLGAAGLLIAKPWKNKKQLAVTKQISGAPEKVVEPLSSGTAVGTAESKNSPVTTKKESFKDDNTPTISTDPLTLAAPGKKQVTQPGSISRNKKNRNINIPILNSTLSGRGNAASSNDISKDNGVTDSKDVKDKRVNSTIPAAVVSGTVHPVKDAVPADKNQQETITATNKLVTKADQVVSNDPTAIDGKNENKSVVQDKAKKEKNKRKKNNSFLFTLSAGPDVSFTGNDQLGRMKLLGGVGIGYSFNNRLIIRTGFYSGRKVYTASPEAYHPPEEFYTYYPYLEKINADCKVYEIPLTFSYNLSRSAKNSFIATAGLSSFLMKKETYDYTYKYTPTGPSYQRQLTIDNEYKHFFSVLTFSGGYQRNIGKNISLLVEPYVKLPLSGVGYGKVKLNSGGVLFSVGIKPFAAKKEKPPVSQ
ncbi:MAG: hypothetical protein SGI83_00150 [Bacteroidota bacterium]|nr:hypothetical protein [Bacteroidota bacterium]